MADSGTPERWLSSGIDSIATRKHRILIAQKPPLLRSERAFDWICRKQTSRNGLVIAAVTCVVPLVISCIIACAPPSPTNFESQIGTIAQITAAIAGALMAVIVFSVQLHAQREDEGAFMTRYLVKKHCVPWIIGYALGFSTFNGLILLFQALGLARNWPLVAAFDIAGLLALGCLTYWLIQQSMRDATVSTFDLGFPLFCHDLADLVAECSYFSDLSARFNEELKSVIFERGDVRFHSFRRGRRERDADRDWLEIELSAANGRVVDVDLVCLKSLNAVLEGLARSTKAFRAELMYFPAAEVTSHAALVISSERVMDAQSSAPLRSKELPRDGHSEIHDQNLRSLNDVISNEVHRDIQNLLSRVYIIQRHVDAISRELTDFFTRYETRLKQLAKSGQSVILRDRLEKYEQIMEMIAVELGACQAWAAHASWSSMANPLSRTYFELVRLAYASNDKETVEALLDSAKAHYRIGVSQRAVVVALWILEVLQYIYFVGTKDHIETYSGYLRESCDSSLHFVFSMLRSRNKWLPKDDVTSNDNLFQREQPFLDAAIRFNMRLVRNAIHVGAFDHACRFVDRLFELWKYRHSLDRYDSAPVEETVDTLHDYSLITLLDCCMSQIDEHQSNAEKRKGIGDVIQELTKYGPSRDAVIAIWELYRGSGYREAQVIDQRLVSCLS